MTRAARNGKQVAAVVELKARFDEERNIAWANRLEQAGAVVSYGVARLKVHAKAILVVHLRVPRPDASGTDLRLMFLLEDLVAAGHKVTLLAR